MMSQTAQPDGQHCTHPEGDSPQMIIAIIRKRAFRTGPSLAPAVIEMECNEFQALRAKAARARDVCAVLAHDPRRFQEVTGLGEDQLLDVMIRAYEEKRRTCALLGEYVATHTNSLARTALSGRIGTEHPQR